MRERRSRTCRRPGLRSAPSRLQEMTDTPLIFPALGPLYQALAPWAEALLRAVIGLALVPHGLRMAFGFFPTTGGPIRDLSMMAAALDRWGYRPGRLWA